MKNIVILLIILQTSITAYSQTIAPERKFIEVTGSAEMMVEPDEIELEIVLTEYDKFKLDKIESDFYAILKSNNISKESVIINDINTYYWWYWWNSREKPYKIRTIKLSLNKETDILKLVNDLNEKWVQSIRISDRKNKNIQKFRKDVKIEAIRAAKTKATYLLESIDEKIGGIISIEELPENNNNILYRNQNMLSNSIVSSNSENDDDAVRSITGIKLKYEVKAKFEIK
jgi:uncharacterized protein YggE